MAVVLVLLFVFCVGGLTTTDGECQDKLPLGILGESNFLPDAEQLPKVCPGVIEYFDCVESQQNENMTSNDISAFHALQDVTQDLCEKDSLLQRAYLASLDCFRDQRNELSRCFEMGYDVYEDYELFSTRNQLNGTGERNPPGQMHCMVGSYVMACTAIGLLEYCGALPHETFMAALRRSKIWEIECLDEAERKLKTEFVDFLERGHKSHFDILKEIMDLRKK